MKCCVKGRTLCLMPLQAWADLLVMRADLRSLEARLLSILQTAAPRTTLSTPSAVRTPLLVSQVEATIRTTSDQRRRAGSGYGQESEAVDPICSGSGHPSRKKVDICSRGQWQAVRPLKPCHTHTSRDAGRYLICPSLRSMSEAHGDGYPAAALRLGDGSRMVRIVRK